MSEEEVTLTIDGKTVSVPKGTTVYAAAKKLGVEIPIFCYHDRMPPFGACRMCLVEVENMPKLQTSCTLEAREGMQVKTTTGQVTEGREGILEFLLINHPLDCPVCDKGGECPLQDQTVKYGPGISRFFEDKRKFPKKVPLGPVLMLDRERCIICARCTRFGDLIAGDNALEFVDRGYRTEVGTPGGGPAESKYIGNTIMICPVGALTSQVYRFRARPWDNDETPSTCTLCPVGCSLTIDSRDGEVMRTRSREDREVNDIWLCDKGWFGYEHIGNPDRLTTPLIRKNGLLAAATWDEAFELIAGKLKDSKKAAAFGGNPLTFEENFAFQSLMRGLGIPHIDHRIGMPLFSSEEEYLAEGMEAPIGTLEHISFASLLGLDITEEFPLLWLRLKQAQNKGAQLRFLGHYAPEIADHLQETTVHAPGEELSYLKAHLQAISGRQNGALLVGSQYLHSAQRKAILQELVRFRLRNPAIALHILDGVEGSCGARLAGMRPDYEAYGKKAAVQGLNALQVLQESSSSGWELLWTAGADPATHFAQELWNAARARLGFLVVQDLFLTATASQADVVLPTLSFFEKEGTFINIEGRPQRLAPGKALPDGLLSDETIFKEMAKRLGVVLSCPKVPDRPQFLQVPPVVSEEKPVPQNDGKLKATFARSLFDRGVRMSRNPHLSGMSKDPVFLIHPAEAQKRGLEEGMEVVVGTVHGKLHCDAKVAEQTIVLPVGYPQVPVADLNLGWINGLPVEIKCKI